MQFYYLAPPAELFDHLHLLQYKGNRVVILDQKLYDNTIQEIISDTSKFEKLNKDPTLKRVASLQCFLHKLKQKNFFNEKEYDI